MQKIKIKYLADIDPVQKIESGDWYDLRCATDIITEAGKYIAIPLGVAMELPEGYEAIVAPRSSIYKKFGIKMANSIGIIDESFKGNNDEWHFLAKCEKDGFIEKNTRICQFRIIEHQPEIVFETVDDLNNSDRGGIGSTGVM